MKIIKVNSPAQTNETINKQLIDDQYPTWIVKSENTKQNESFNQWWERKKEYISNRPRYNNVKGIYLYDVQPIINDMKEWCLMIRYDYIV